MSTKPARFPEEKENSTWPNPETISPGTSHLKLALQQGEPLPQLGMLGTSENKPVSTNLMDSRNWTETGASSQKLRGNFSSEAQGATGSWLKSEPGQPIAPQAGSASPRLGPVPGFSSLPRSLTHLRRVRTPLAQDLQPQLLSCEKALCGQGRGLGRELLWALLTGGRP